jgi:hypothetical protein
MDSLFNNIANVTDGGFSYLSNSTLTIAGTNISNISMQSGGSGGIIYSDIL